MSYSAMPAGRGPADRRQLRDEQRAASWRQSRSGKRVRGHFVLKDLVERTPGRWQMTVDASVEIEGEAKPALVAEWIFLYFVS